MATDLIVLGPVKILVKERTGCSKHIDSEDKEKFLIELDRLGISSKQGCYIFALRSGKGFCPWYVGKATRTMRQECMDDGKLLHYNDVLFRGHKGTPVVFFVAPEGTKNKVPRDICDDMETFLIQVACHENPDICNKQKTALPQWSIKGVIRGGKGKRNPVELSFKKMMGL